MGFRVQGSYVIFGVQCQGSSELVSRFCRRSVGFGSSETWNFARPESQTKPAEVRESGQWLPSSLALQMTGAGSDPVSPGLGVQGFLGE